jgi:hypothetical protein
MNPPTPGHIALIKEMLTFAQSIGAVPRAYITSTHNTSKMTTAQKKQPVYGLAKEKRDASSDIPYVKHKNYENPLSPEAKKYFIQTMLLNYLDMSFEDSDPIIVVDKECNGLFKAIGCAKEIQEDPDKIYFVMGREIDPGERESREAFCINKSSGTLIAQDEYGSKLRCHFLERTKDEGISGLSGSKVRLLAAENDLTKLYEVYSGYLSEQQVDALVREIRSGLNMSESKEKTQVTVSVPTTNRTKRLRSPSSESTGPSKRIRQSVTRGGKRKSKKRGRKQRRASKRMTWRTRTTRRNRK